jgi:hypothetical protein
VRLQLGGDPGDLVGAVALVATGLDRVVPRPQLAQQPIGFLLGLDLVELVLTLLEGLLCRCLDLVEEPHVRSLR